MLRDLQRFLVRVFPDDILDAGVRWFCLACVGCGAGLALGGAAYTLTMRSQGMDAGMGDAFITAGMLLCWGGAGGAVVMGRAESGR